MMKSLPLTIIIDEIPAGGQAVRGVLPPEWLGDTLLPPYIPMSPLRVDLVARRFDENVLVSGTVGVDLHFACSRTLAPGEFTLSAPVHELFQPAAQHASKLGGGIDADEISENDITLYRGKTLDIEPILRELLVLAQDPYPMIQGARDTDEDGPGPAVWSSGADEIDPRWARLAQIKLD